MNGSNAFDFGTIDHRLLAPEQLERLKRQGMNIACRERSEALRALFDWLGAGLRRAAAAAWSGTRKLALWGVNATAGRLNAFQARRAHRAAVAALEGLDDHLLKDIGVRRSEIGSTVAGLGRDPTRRRRGARSRNLNQETALDHAA